ncbi:MAG: ApaG domain [Verrucomicrobia bacterium]|nr:ApaG domain [Verrucomicrobiota bacterium]
MNVLAPPVELTGLSVSLDRLVYHRLPPEKSHGRPHAFVYFLTIRNGSDTTVTIRGRKWVVTHEDGGQVVVEGDGVVGQHPVIPPGRSFSYNSFHTISGQAACAEGAFLAVDDSGRAVMTRIRPFRLQVPAGEC